MGKRITKKINIKCNSGIVLENRTWINYNNSAARVQVCMRCESSSFLSTSTVWKIDDGNQGSFCYIFGVIDTAWTIL